MKMKLSELKALLESTLEELSIVASQEKRGLIPAVGTARDRAFLAAALRFAIEAISLFEKGL